MRNCLVNKCKAEIDVDEARRRQGNANGFMDSRFKDAPCRVRAVR